MEHYAPFDAYCTVGRHRLLGPGGRHTVGDLLRDMDRHGIAEALVVDSLARENHPADGNPRVSELLREQPRLRPLWVALPEVEEMGLPAPETWLEALRASGAGAVVLCPRQYRFPLSDWCVDRLLEPLASQGIPVIVDGNDLQEPLHWDSLEWEAIVSLCRRWPSLPVIAREWRIRRANRTIYRALDECPNLALELSGYWLWRGVEEIVDRWGPERLLYGSNWPMLNHGQTLAMLTCAEIDEDAKRLIAGDNLRNLLGWSAYERPDFEPEPPADEFVALGRSGERDLAMRFQDCHGHIGGRMNHYHVPGGDLDRTVAEMERQGVERTCVFSFAGVLSDERFGNDIVAEAVRRYPERFVGFAMLNPHRGESDMLEELARCEAMGLRGIKLIPHYQSFPTEHPLVEAACRWADERAWIVLNHDWGSPPWLAQLVERYRRMCFFTGHTTTAHAETMRRFDNLFVCSCPLLGPGDCESVVAAIGADRLLFGSDLQDLPISWGLGPILFARLPVEQKRMVLGGNLSRILERWSVEG